MPTQQQIDQIENHHEFPLIPKAEPPKRWEDYVDDINKAYKAGSLDQLAKAEKMAVAFGEFLRYNVDDLLMDVISMSNRFNQFIEQYKP